MGTQRPSPAAVSPAAEAGRGAAQPADAAAERRGGRAPAPWRLAPFLDALERRLKELRAEELREVILDHAQRLPVARRAGFLALFAAGDSERVRAVDDGDPELPGDVARFVAGEDHGAGAAGSTGRRHGGVPARAGATRAAAYEHLLERAGRLLLAGDAAGARAAYRDLLGVLAEAGEGDGTPAVGVPVDLVDAGLLDEAVHRYLRAVWESEPASSRAAALVEAVQAVALVGADVTIAGVEAARRAALPDPGVTLSDLIARLRSIEASTPGVARQVRALLAEATERRDGIDGLADLAREKGAGQGEAFCDWIDGLVRVGRTGDAEEAAREALDTLPADERARARIAERLAALAAVRGDEPALLDACRAAWRADPTMRRLLALIATAAAIDRSAAVLAAEADGAGDGRLARREGLAATVLLLAHRVDDAVALLQGAPPGSWASAYGRPGAVVVPFLLVGASAAASDARFDGTLLAALVDGADAVARGDGGDDAALRDFRMLLAKVTDTAEPPTLPGQDLRLSRLLLAALAAHPADGEERAAWLEAGRDAVLMRVEDVVGGRYRSAYEQVARLAAACAEAITLVEGDDAGAAFVDELHAHHPQHTAFRSALRAAAGASPLL